MTHDDALQQAITAVQAGRMDIALPILSGILQQDAHCEAAWLWMAACVDTQEKRLYCLRRVVAINPSNQSARDQLAKLTPADAGLAVPVSAAKPAIPAPLPQVAKPAAKPAPKPAVPSPASSAKPSTSIFSRLAKNPVLAGFAMLAVLLVAGICVVAVVWFNYRNTSVPSAPVLAGAVSSPAQAPAVLPPTWTVSPSPTLRLTETQSPSPIPTITETLSPQQNEILAQPLIREARDLMLRMDYAAAAEKWSAVIERSPQNADAYYQRGLCYMHQNEHQTSFAAYQENLLQALPNFDRAIALNPEVGDYYMQRAYVYTNMLELYSYRVDKDRLMTIALENYRAANALGTSVEFAEREIPSALNHTGACQQGLAEAQRQLEVRGPNRPESGLLNSIFADSYLCLGQYDQALEHINRALKVESTCQRQIQKTIILMAMQRDEDALNVIDGCIQNSPSYGGYRYYLRALIQYDRGKKEQAKQDLLTGMGNTFFHDGLFLYLQGKFALDEGDTQTGRLLLQQAEASMSRFEGAALLKRLQNEMAALRIEPEVPVPQFAITTTPIAPEIVERIPPSPTPFPTITPTLPAQPAANPPSNPSANPTVDPNPQPVGSVDATQVDASVGTGLLVLEANHSVFLHLVPREKIAVKLARKITFYLMPEGGGAAPPIQVNLWTRSGGWRMLEPEWGDNQVEFPSFFIGPQGDFYFSIRNYSNQTVTIDNAGFNIVVELEDGTPYSYGMLP